MKFHCVIQQFHLKCPGCPGDPKVMFDEFQASKTIQDSNIFPGFHVVFQDLLELPAVFFPSNKNDGYLVMSSPVHEKSHDLSIPSPKILVGCSFRWISSSLHTSWVMTSETWRNPVMRRRILNIFKVLRRKKRKEWMACGNGG